MPQKKTENHALLCLGSNLPDAADMLERGLRFLRGKGRVEAATPFYAGEAEGESSPLPYHNCLVRLATGLDRDTFCRDARVFQDSIRNAYAGALVPFDLDVVEWNDEVLRLEMLATNYFKKGLSLL